MILSGFGLERFSAAVLLSLVPVGVVVARLVPQKGTAVSMSGKRKNLDPAGGKADPSAWGLAFGSLGVGCLVASAGAALLRRLQHSFQRPIS